MAKDYIWHTAGHEIRCVISNNRYILYDNDEYVTAVYRKLFMNLRGGMAENVTIAGRVCRFVVWDGMPDLEVDGRLLRAGCSYEEGFQHFRNSLKVMTVCYFCFAGFWALLSALGTVNYGGLFFAGMLLLIGLAQLRTWKRLK